MAERLSQHEHREIRLPTAETSLAELVAVGVALHGAKNEDGTHSLAWLEGDQSFQLVVTQDGSGPRLYQADSNDPEKTCIETSIGRADFARLSPDQQQQTRSVIHRGLAGHLLKVAADRFGDQSELSVLYKGRHAKALNGAHAEYEPFVIFHKFTTAYELSPSGVRCINPHTAYEEGHPLPADENGLLLWIAGALANTERAAPQATRVAERLLVRAPDGIDAVRYSQILGATHEIMQWQHAERFMRKAAKGEMVVRGMFDCDPSQYGLSNEDSQSTAKMSVGLIIDSDDIAIEAFVYDPAVAGQEADIHFTVTAALDASTASGMQKAPQWQVPLRGNGAADVMLACVAALEDAYHAEQLQPCDASALSHFTNSLLQESKEN